MQVAEKAISVTAVDSHEGCEYAPTIMHALHTMCKSLSLGRICWVSTKRVILFMSLLLEST